MPKLSMKAVSMTATIVAVLMCASCAGVSETGPVDVAVPVVSTSASSTAPAENRLVVSDGCSAGNLIGIEWDGSTGAATRVGALDQIIDWLKSSLDSLPAEATHTNAGAFIDDPVQLRVGIRGLEALKSELPAVEAVAEANYTVKVAAHTDTGEELSWAIIGSPGLGVSGYRVLTWWAVAWTSDDHSCS